MADLSEVLLGTSNCAHPRALSPQADSKASSKQMAAQPRLLLRPNGATAALPSAAPAEG